LAFAVVLSILMAGGCATPIGVTSLGRDYAYDQIDRSALGSGEVSSYTTVVLHRYHLERLSAKDPVQCLIELHQRACTDNRRDTLFAFAELSFLLGKKNCRITTDGRKLAPENFFAAAVLYAYFYLLGPGEEAPPDAFDRRFRLACDFYNRGLGYVIASRENRGPTGDVKWLLPVGSILIHSGGSASDINFPLAENETLVSADRFQIHGLSVRNRNAGLGSPILIVRRRDRGAGMTKSTAATVFLRVNGSLSGIAKGTLGGNIDIVSAFTRDHVEVDGRRIPLEEDLTLQIAYSLNDPFLWQVKKKLFRLGQSPFDPGIYPAQPYQHGKIPVLFVHGTMSSPLLWAEMWNTLLGDRTLREKYQFWFYLYDSAKPVGQSAVHLRESIETTVRTMDPDGQDPMLRQMVVIGHSQGGLLTKLTATHTGDALIGAVTGKTLAELKLAPEDERLVSRVAIYEPLPEVKRVVFISTPHRGSYLAGGLARKLARRFLDLPKQALQTTAQLLTLAPTISPDLKLASTSLDSMTPDNPAMLALAEIPVTPPIKAHSIIAVKGDDVPPKGGDGVVKYASAHIAGVESELVVRGGHSCQGNPTTIEEVRRILLEHMQHISGSSPSGSTAHP
jgi:pimeloyl-ACP methyl ester carboxylesterase